MDKKPPEQITNIMVLEEAIRRAEIEDAFVGIEDIIDSRHLDVMETPIEHPRVWFDAYPYFGSNEGMFLNCQLHIRVPGGPHSTVNCGYFRSHHEDCAAMQALGQLGGALTWHATQYLRENVHLLRPAGEEQ